MALTVCWTIVINTKMFAHCLLPALLLLATVDYSTAQFKPKPPVYPPVITNKFSGSTENVNRFIKQNYELLPKQCYGVLNDELQAELRCAPKGIVGYGTLSLNVTVYDYKPVKITFPDLSPVRATVERNKPCPNKAAIVEVEVGCGPII